MDEERKKDSNPSERALHQLRLPGWLVKEQVGLGDGVKKVTYRVGIKACAACEKRAAALNRWMVFSPR